MTAKTFEVPNISCGHCTHTIEMEVGELDGVRSVRADQTTKHVTVEWDEPATWEQIEALLERSTTRPPNRLSAGRSSAASLPLLQASVLCVLDICCGLQALRQEVCSLSVCHSEASVSG